MLINKDIIAPSRSRINCNNLKIVQHVENGAKQRIIFSCWEFVNKVWWNASHVESHMPNVNFDIYNTKYLKIYIEEVMMYDGMFTINNNRVILLTP